MGSTQSGGPGAASSRADDPARWLRRRMRGGLFRLMSRWLPAAEPRPLPDLEKLERVLLVHVSQRIGNTILVTPGLDALLERLRAASRDWPFTVAWADCTTRGSAMGRGILTVGRWASASEAPAAAPAPRRRIGIPLELPVGLVFPLSIRIFNSLWFHALGGTGRRGVTGPRRTTAIRRCCRRAGPRWRDVAALAAGGWRFPGPSCGERLRRRIRNPWR